MAIPTYFILFNRTLQGILESVQAVAIDAATPGARTQGAGVQAAKAGEIPGRSCQGPAVQPDCVVFQLRRAGCLRADPAPDPADGRGDARWHRLPERWRHRPRRPRLRSRDPRPGDRALDDYVPAMLLYFVVMPRLYGFSTLGSFWQLVALAFPFILATSFLGQSLGLVFRHRETAVLLVLATSLPQFFLVGVSWPAEALPAFLRSTRDLLPSVSAIDGFVRINQMGADLLEYAAGGLRCGH